MEPREEFHAHQIKGAVDDKGDAHSDRDRRAQIRAAVRCRWPFNLATPARHFLDKRWVSPWPIPCWLIEHPEGRFIVDTGDTVRNSVPGYLPR